jgi:hypothetical protein
VHPSRARKSPYDFVTFRISIIARGGCADA